MRIVRRQNMLCILGVLVISLLFQLPLASALMRPESQELTQLLSDANDEARELASDAEEMQMLTLNDTNWVTHALMLSKVKGHVDNMALLIEKLKKLQKSGSELQEQAVQQMLPLVQELSANTTAAINYLNQNKSRPTSETYKQYLNKNAEAARQLSSMISTLLDYQKSMAEIEKMRSKLGCLGIGLLSGGYGQEELEQAGAYGVYQDPADLLSHLDEIGIRIAG
jgi:predicted O-linked N-acetylglucosamine transferase (SPINDLY family)